MLHNTEHDMCISEIVLISQICVIWKDAMRNTEKPLFQLAGKLTARDIPTSTQTGSESRRQSSQIINPA